MATGLLELHWFPVCYHSVRLRLRSAGCTLYHTPTRSVVVFVGGSFCTISPTVSACTFAILRFARHRALRTHTTYRYLLPRYVWTPPFPVQYRFSLPVFYLSSCYCFTHVRSFYRLFLHCYLEFWVRGFTLLVRYVCWLILPFHVFVLPFTLFTVFVTHFTFVTGSRSCTFSFCHAAATLFDLPATLIGRVYVLPHVSTVLSFVHLPFHTVSTFVYVLFTAVIWFSRFVPFTLRCVPFWNTPSTAFTCWCSVTRTISVVRFRCSLFDLFLLTFRYGLPFDVDSDHHRKNTDPIFVQFVVVSGALPMFSPFRSIPLRAPPLIQYVTHYGDGWCWCSTATFSFPVPRTCSFSFTFDFCVTASDRLNSGSPLHLPALAVTTTYVSHIPHCDLRYVTISFAAPRVFALPLLFCRHHTVTGYVSPPVPHHILVVVRFSFTFSCGLLPVLRMPLLRVTYRFRLHFTDITTTYAFRVLLPGLYIVVLFVTFYLLFTHALFCSRSCLPLPLRLPTFCYTATWLRLLRFRSATLVPILDYTIPLITVPLPLHYTLCCSFYISTVRCIPLPTTGLRSWWCIHLPFRSHSIHIGWVSTLITILRLDGWFCCILPFRWPFFYRFTATAFTAFYVLLHDLIYDSIPMQNLFFYIDTDTHVSDAIYIDPDETATI